MDIKVLKFGGSSLADADQYRKVAAIIRAEDNRRYVVASAPGKRNSEDTKVTDMLYACYELASRKENIDNAFAKVEARYNGIIADLGMDFSLEKEFATIRMAILHHAGEDYVASRGEYLGAMILAKYLGYTFIDAENGIYFKKDGTFDSKRTYEALGARLSEVERAVVPGFYGSMPNGTIKTFSRGGSDISGAIVARAVGASIYENWTDVSGMLMADPRIIDNPRVIEEITYRELRELAYMGATVMHDEAIFPVREACIPINIRNTNAPQDPGTLIVAATENLPKDTIITGVAGRKGYSSITMEKDCMNTEIGFGRKVLEVLENFGISFEHTPTGIDTMSVVVATSAIEGQKDAITSAIFKEANADTVSIEDNMALIAIVGRGMVRNKGTAGKLFSAIAGADINIRMIDQGSGENNIIVGVGEEDYLKALQAIYSAFVS